jgi:hypothetical protein
VPVLRNSPKPPARVIRRGTRILKGAPQAGGYTAVGSGFGTANAAALTTFSVTTVTAGDFILASVLSENSSTRVATALSSSNVTWSTLGASANTSVARSARHQVFLGVVTSVATATVTITWAAGTTGSFESVAGQEFSSTTGIPVLDKQATLDSAGTATWPSLTPAAAGELYWGFAEDNTASVSGSTSGYVYNINADLHSNGVAYNVNCGATATAPVWGDSGQSDGIVVLVKPGGGLGVPQRPLARRTAAQPDLTRATFT